MARSYPQPASLTLSWPGAGCVPGWRPAGLRGSGCRADAPVPGRSCGGNRAIGGGLSAISSPPDAPPSPTACSHRLLRFFRRESCFLLFYEPLLGFSVVARVRDRLPLCGNEQHLQAHVDARLAPPSGYWLAGPLDTGGGGIVPSLERTVAGFIRTAV